MVEEDFAARYRNLEERFKALAQVDGDVYLPNPAAEGPVQFVLVCMEPSLGRWARSAEQARERVDAGFRNFLPSDEVALLHYCVRRYLCRPQDRYHITDLSKGAMLVKRAASERDGRYRRWYPLFKEELDLIAAPGARYIAVGREVAIQLERHGFKKPIHSVMHYSSQAGLARHKGIEGREAGFAAFMGSVSLDDVVVTAKDVLSSARVPAEIVHATLAKLRRLTLTVSRQQLMFAYKTAFESLRTQVPGVSERVV